MWRGKSAKKERSNEKNFQEDLRQRHYTDGQTSNTTRKDGKELEAMEGQEASKKRDDEDDPGRGRRS